MSQKSFVIDRSKWLFGTGGSDSQLHRPKDGKMCCVGQYLYLCGVPIKSISNISTASQVVRGLPKGLRWLLKTWALLPPDDSKKAEGLYRANDDHRISRAVRESRVARLFTRAGVKVSFKGSYDGLD